MTTAVRDWRGNIKSLDAAVVVQVENEETKPQENVQVEYMKDEFGRDVVVPKCSNKEKERKHKKSTRRKDKKSKKAAFKGTPPPADPFRPELDESRTMRRIKDRKDVFEANGSKHHKRYREDRSRSRSSRRHFTKHVKSSRRSCSRSTSRGRSRSRSPRPHNKKNWDHSGFENQSPSPIREVDESYRPEPEPWISRAGGVYIPRK